MLLIANNNNYNNNYVMKNHSDPKLEAHVVDKNIEAIHSLRKSADEERRLDQKFVDFVAVFLGSPNSLYVHIFVYTILIGFFLSFEQLGVIASVEAIALSIFVLVNQRRLNSIERRNSDLHLQTTLLVEQEITRIARVTELIAKKLGLDSAEVKDLSDVNKEIQPIEVLKRISDHEKREPTPSTSDSYSKPE